MWRGLQLVARAVPSRAVGIRCASDGAVASAAVQHRRQAAAATAAASPVFSLSSPSLYTTFSSSSGEGAGPAAETTDAAFPCDLFAGMNIQSHTSTSSRAGKLELCAWVCIFLSFRGGAQRKKKYE